jgi:PAS domain S-box-containing protein
MASARATSRAAHYLLSRTLQGANIRTSGAIEWSSVQPPARNAAAELRSSTSAVANRLFNQEAVKLDPQTPLTLERALQDSPQARVVTLATAPHTIIHVNSAWEALCNYSANDILGREGLNFLHGPRTNSKTVDKLNAAIEDGKRVRVQLVNYKGDGTPFLNKLQVTPLRSKFGEITHLLGVLSEVEGADLDALECEYTSLSGL